MKTISESLRNLCMRVAENQKRGATKYDWTKQDITEALTAIKSEVLGVVPNSFELAKKIREIWKPLYDLGYNGAEQVDAQYMAYLIRQATTETTQLLDDVIKALKELCE